ncbi:MAG: N-acetylmuramoyl-L-alanine amidase [Firmicutes bacterium]|nr:N-acetylmuramoyl-L-alanine amidase [Bacillota bacterium]
MKSPVVILWTNRAWLVALGTIGIVMAFLLILTYVSVKVSVPLSEAVCGKTIVIDPGHGGIDAGAKGRSGVMEKDVVLDIGLRLAGLFNRAAVYTLLTRNTDDGLIEPGNRPNAGWKRLDLEGRIALATEHNADIYVSIHANSFPEPVWSGAHTFYHSKSDDAKVLAIAIQKELVSRLGPNLRKAKSGDDYFVLRKSTMPAVIVEVGFLSNPREEALLAQADYRTQVAEAIFYGTVNYLVDSYEKGKPRERDESRPTSDLPSEFTDIQDHASLYSRARAALNLEENEVALYFAGPTNFDDDLMPEVREIPGLGAESNPDLRASRVVQELIKGPARGSVLCPTLPRGTSLKSVKIVDNVAYVDFSKEITENHWGGSRAEELTVYSIVNTLTDVPGIKEVQILIEGLVSSTIAGHIILDKPLSPNFDIIEFGQF